MHDLNAVWALIVAAGRGARAGEGLPKQYRTLAGRPLLAHTVEPFLAHPRIAGVAVVIAEPDLALYDMALGAFAGERRLGPPIFGGAERQESVRAGLEALADRRPGAVLIHDAARPLVSAELISDVLSALEGAEGAIAALPLSDTLKRAAQDGTVGETVPRGGLWRAQTPQGFRFPAILAAHRRAAGEAHTDDAAIAEAAGLTVALVPSSDRNLKVTRAEDFAVAEALLSGPSAPPARMAIGQGFDVHRLGPGNGVTLCGVFLPGAQSLIGHSDADVGLHALTDAVLGALGAGDIGDHFPPSDERWRGADSGRFVSHAASLVREAGGRIAHLDVTLVCEAPKIKPYREAMRARIAQLAALALSRVSVKATTTEALGFTGRGEGIAAMAVATLTLPQTD